MDTIPRYLVCAYRVMWDILSQYIEISHATLHRITSKHQANANLTKPCHLVAVYSWFFRLCLCPHLRLSSVWPFSSCFCCPSARHIIGLTVPLANGNLVNSGLGLPPERMMFVFVSFFTFLPFFLFPVCFPSWYLVPGAHEFRCEVHDMLLLLTQSGISGWYFVKR